MAEGRAGKVLEFHANSPSVLCAAFSAGAPRLLATGGTDHRVLITPVGGAGAARATGAAVVLVGHQSPVTAITFSGAQQQPEVLVGGSSTGQLRVWDVAKSQQTRAYCTGVHKGEVTALDHHPFGDFFVSSSDDGNIKVWDLRKKACLQTYKHQEGRDAGRPRVETVRFSPDGRMVASGNADGS
eukprot:gene5701-39325_t